MGIINNKKKKEFKKKLKRAALTAGALAGTALVGGYIGNKLGKKKGEESGFTKGAASRNEEVNRLNNNILGLQKDIGKKDKSIQDLTNNIKSKENENKRLKKRVQINQARAKRGKEKINEINKANEKKINSLLPKKSDIDRKMSTQEYEKSERKKYREENREDDRKKTRNSYKLEDRIIPRIVSKLPDKNEFIAYQGLNIPENEKRELLKNNPDSNDYSWSKARDKKELVAKLSNIIGRQFRNPVRKTSDGKIHVKPSYLKAKEIVDKLNNINFGKKDPLRYLYPSTFDNKKEQIDYSTFDIDMDAINKHNADIDAKNKNKVVTQSAVDYIDNLLDTFYEAYYYDLITDNEYEAFVESVYEADDMDEIEDIETVFESYIE